jgi:hypothetical protein
MSPVTLTAPQRRAVAVEALCSDESVVRAYRGLPMRAVTLERVVRAARVLQLPPPPGSEQAMALPILDRVPSAS